MVGNFDSSCCSC